MNAYLNDDIPSKSETASFFDSKHNRSPLFQPSKNNWDFYELVAL